MVSQSGPRTRFEENLTVSKRLGDKGILMISLEGLPPISEVEMGFEMTGSELPRRQCIGFISQPVPRARDAICSTLPTMEAPGSRKTLRRRLVASSGWPSRSSSVGLEPQYKNQHGDTKGPDGGRCGGRSG